ncbi:hypothetical protein GDO81_020118 [Engystomops pustulosus]|uniref:Uncharacterized protein n=1 Tax=Engystomops pustulosus TaxID=76066 RepID=A0AAV6YVR6_ENGPU|nr:hypothetical protein GDO81_020118 [Engystomops pustulosus]
MPPRGDHGAFYHRVPGREADMAGGVPQAEYTTSTVSQIPRYHLWGNITCRWHQQGDHVPHYHHHKVLPLAQQDPSLHQQRVLPAHDRSHTYHV